jgi:hypothetical protein
MLLLVTKEQNMVPNPKPKTGAALLITIIIVAIVCTILLSTQLILIQQSYESTFGYARNEQSIYNSLANLTDAIWFRLNSTIDTTTGTYTGYNNTDVSTSFNNTGFESQTNLNDSARRARASFNTAAINQNIYADIAILTDRSASMAVLDFDTNQYTDCISGINVHNCSCLIPDPSTGLSSCEPMRTVRASLTEFYKQFGYVGPLTPTPAAHTVTRERVRIGQVVFGSTLTSLPSYASIAYVKPPITGDLAFFGAYKINDSNFEQFKIESASDLKYPSGYSNLGRAVNFAHRTVLADTRDVSDGEYYKYMVMMTDGFPNAYGDTHTNTNICNHPSVENLPAYGTNEYTNLINACSNSAEPNNNTYPTNYAINELRIAANSPNNICILILAYGPLARTPNLHGQTSYTINEHLINFIHGNNIPRNQDNPNGNCHNAIDIGNITSSATVNGVNLTSNTSEATKIKDALKYIRFAVNTADINTQLGDIGESINDTIHSFTIEELDPQ